MMWHHMVFSMIHIGILIRDHRMLMIHSIYYIQQNALDVVVHNVHSVLERCSKANVCGREREEKK